MGSREPEQKMVLSVIYNRDSLSELSKVALISSPRDNWTSAIVLQHIIFLSVCTSTLHPPSGSSKLLFISCCLYSKREDFLMNEIPSMHR